MDQERVGAVHGPCPVALVVTLVRNMHSVSTGRPEIVVFALGVDAARTQVFASIEYSQLKREVGSFQRVVGSIQRLEGSIVRFVGFVERVEGGPAAARRRARRSIGSATNKTTVSAPARIPARGIEGPTGGHHPKSGGAILGQNFPE